jgi:hypothetical protein
MTRGRRSASSFAPQCFHAAGAGAVITLVLLAMATFVAYMRHRMRPISSRDA